MDTNNDKISIVEVNDLLKGYNVWNKVREVYIEIKKELDLKIPLVKSKDAMVTIEDPNYRGKSCRWEMYQKNNSTILLEIFGEIHTYARPHEYNRLDLSLENASAQRLKITIAPSNNDISDTINKILEKYPENSK